MVSLDISKSEIVGAALDKSKSIDPYITQTLEKWRVDLERRTPAPVYRESVGGFPVYEGTDYDLFTFLMRLSERGAVINIPEYARLIRKTLKPNQRVVSPENRHGQIIRLASRKERHSFSVQIKDYNVVETRPDGSEKVGLPRNFTIVDYSGRMHPGWTKLELRPTPEEWVLLQRNKQQPVKGQFEFKNFVHPAMTDLIYTLLYIEAKALAQLCYEEGSHYRKLEKNLRESGVKLPIDTYLTPESKPSAPGEHEAPDNEPEKQVKVTRIVAEAQLPAMVREFPVMGMKRDGTIISYPSMPTRTSDKQYVLRYAEHRADDMSFTIGIEIRNVTSAVELAMFLYGFRGERMRGNERLPPWITEEWSSGKRKRQVIRLSEDVGLSYFFSERTVTVKESALTDYKPGMVIEHV